METQFCIVSYSFINNVKILHESVKTMCLWDNISAPSPPMNAIKQNQLNISVQKMNCGTGEDSDQP